MSEAHYRRLLSRTHECGESLKEFLVEIVEAPQAEHNKEILALADETREHLELMQGKIDQIWDLFKREL
jgi:hypothetical protein